LTIQVETKIASYNHTMFKCDVLARAGVELAKQQLMQDLDPLYDLGADASKEKWHTNPDYYENFEMGEGVINIRVVPEDGKLNINVLAAAPEALGFLLEQLQVPPPEIDVLVDSIADWVDTDVYPRVNGAEDDYYGKLEPPYRPKNGPIDRLSELMLVQGMTPDLFYGRTSGHPLKDVLTSLTTGKVNVNVAPALVLAVLLGVEEGQAGQIVEYRNGDDGIEGTEDDRVLYSRGDLPLASSNLTAEDLKALENVLDFKSNFFTIVAEGRIGDVSKTIRVTLVRDAKGFKTLAWLEGLDALR
jgi:type II secretory pathway component PulK